MDNFWIFIVIIGAVISLAQKGQKQAPAESDDTTQPNPQQEWERRIREIMNEQKGSTPPLGREATTPTQRPQTSHLPRPTVTPTPKAVRTNNSGERVATLATTPKMRMYAPKQESFNTPTNNHKPTTSESNKMLDAKEEGSNIDAILDDFSMEKAVIYAEILKPKYEEY
ncbi:MAG: hypothetical protein IJ378_03090 [Alistipes sp.]|nr:hypothetical protein [Alistipes sp.]